jgi:hypothetical protein
VVVDADDVPLVVLTTPANVDDEAVLPALLDGVPAVQGPRGRPRRKPGPLSGGRAYGTAAVIAPVISMGIGCFLARRSSREHGGGLGAFRYVVERSPANFSQFKRIAMCHERKPEHWQALNEIAACCLVATRLLKYET